MNESPVPIRRTNPDLGWFFYNPAPMNTEEQERITGRFADNFLEHLGRRDSARILRSGTDTPAKNSAILFPDHGAVYIPADFFPDHNNISEVFNAFGATSAGSEFSNWTYERDKEAFATTSLAEKIASNGLVQGAEPMRPIVGEAATGLTETLVPNELVRTVEPMLPLVGDAISTSQGIGVPDNISVVVYWHLLQVLAEPLWPFGKGEGSIVAVLDTGLDLNNRLLTSGSLGGVSFVPGTSAYNDDHGHGTHVTGILAARPGTSSDGRPLYWSIAPGASHYSVKVLDRTGGGSFATITQGLDWARNKGVHVINMSLGGSQQPPAVFASAIALASQRSVLIAAAGNNGPGADTVTWPARYREVIGVGAVDRNRVIANFSSRGPTNPGAFVEDNVECVAPGVDIYSNRLGGGAQDLKTLSGTSMAAPIVSGICALLRQKDTSLLGVNGFRYRLRRSFIDLGIGGPDNWYGLGLTHFDPRS